MFGNKTILSIFALTFAFASFAGAQSVEEQWKANQANYGPLTGKYVGNITDTEGKMEQVQLVLVPITQLKASPSGNETAVVTSLSGSLSICLQRGESCFDDPSLKNDIVPVAIFQEGSYDAQSKLLFLTMTPDLIGDPRGSQDVSDQTIYFEGIADGQQVAGKYWSGINPKPTELILKKQ